MSKNFMIVNGAIIGFILGVFACITSMFLTVETNLSNSEYLGNGVMFAVFGFFMYRGIKGYRDREHAGSFAFGQVFIKGLMITLISGIVYSFVWTVYTSVSDTDFSTIYMEMTVKEMQESGASDEDIALTVQEIEQFMPYYENPAIKFLITIMEPLFPGLVVSLILGFVLKRKNEDEQGIETSNN